MNDPIKNLKAINWRRLVTLFIYIIGIVAVAWLTLFFGGQVGALRMEVAEKRAEVKDLKDTQQEILSLKNSIEQFEDQQSELDTLVPTRKQVLTNIKLLEELSNNTSNDQTISIKEVFPEEKTTRRRNRSRLDILLPAGFDKADYTINLNGNFVDLISYLKLLEHQPFLTLVEDINIQAEKTRGTPDNPAVNIGSIRTRIEGKFYYVEE